MAIATEMRVAINTLFLQPGRGRGTLTYVRRCAVNIARIPDFNVSLLTCAHNECLFEDLPGVSLVRCATIGSQRPLRIIYEQMLLERRAQSIGADVLFCPGYLAPVTRHIPTVVAIHDTQYLDVPAGLSKSFRWTYQALVPRGARAARRVITISEFSRQQILKHLQLPSEHVVAVHLAPLDDGWTAPALPEITATLNRFDLRRGFALSVSSSAVHKNIPRLIRAYQRLPQPLRDAFPLVFVGQHSDWYPLPESMLRTSGVRFLGYVSEVELRCLYALAGGFILASYYEGFGLPVIEAMQAGVPVACARAGSLPEIAGGAALLFDPHDEHDIAANIERLLSQPQLRAELRILGASNVLRFSWRECAARTAEILRRAVDVGPAGFG